uniref:Secreted protein n=1 Tax=Arundo donax TaxID=35708 RepID=A0A0A9CN46_ARUDO
MALSRLCLLFIVWLAEFGQVQLRVATLEAEVTIFITFRWTQLHIGKIHTPLLQEVHELLKVLLRRPIMPAMRPHSLQNSILYNKSPCSRCGSSCKEA